MKWNDLPFDEYVELLKKLTPLEAEAIYQTFLMGVSKDIANQLSKLNQ